MSGKDRWRINNSLFEALNWQERSLVTNTTFLWSFIDGFPAKTSKGPLTGMGGLSSLFNCPRLADDRRRRMVSAIILILLIKPTVMSILLTNAGNWIKCHLIKRDTIEIIIPPNCLVDSFYKTKRPNFYKRNTDPWPDPTFSVPVHELGRSSIHDVTYNGKNYITCAVMKH
jgi:hypothetical protein